MLKARIIMRCVDKGDTARILAGCDIGATPDKRAPTEADPETEVSPEICA
jgi:hypothetical protein